MRIDRRTLIGMAAAALPLPVLAAETGFAIDWQGAPVDPEVAARFARQVEGVRALPVDPAILDFFSRQPIFINPRPGIPSVTNRRGIFLTRDAFPDDNPVLLHELCHRYQGQRIDLDPVKRQRLRAFFAEENARPHWRADAYMYTNVNEFWAMTSSVVLHGRAARPPFAREAVREGMPGLYEWIVAEFAFRG